MTPPLSTESRQQLQTRIASYLAWQESPEFTPCPRCEGKGYHHGFGEDGRDPDWCDKCGGPGELATEPGTWDGDDLLREALAALSVPECSHGHTAYTVGCVSCVFVFKQDTL